MNFSVCVIAKNEERTLPRLVESLAEFQKKGGEILVLDTGSTDLTTEKAKELGCRVFSVGGRFLKEIERGTAEKINEAFLVGDEKPIVLAHERVFDFAAARNYLAGLASNDMIAMPDADETYTQLDLSIIERDIKNGIEQFEYNFVFSHDTFGNEAIKFLHSKFYDRRKLRWEGIVHEVLKGDANKKFLDESIIKLEHWQNHETSRGQYLVGLALDAYQHPDNDRNAHYLGRELLWSNRPRTAIAQFEKHVAMKRWLPERAQSLIFIGDAYIQLKDEEKAVEYYHKAFQLDASRRESLIRLAEFYFKKNDHQRVAAYAAAALEIPNSFFYANFQEHYTYIPHQLMYWALWYLGRKEESREHFQTAFAIAPEHPKHLHDYRFYHDLPKVSFVIPTLGRPEGLVRCLDSIKNLIYPQELIETIVIEDNPRMGVPKRFNEGVNRSKGDIIVYASNDVEFLPESLMLAVIEAQKDQFADGIVADLVAFNTGTLLPDKGNICEHFLITRDFAEKIGGRPIKVFDEDFHHVGVDNLLWAIAEKRGRPVRCEKAIVNHFHFSKGGEMDEIAKMGWSEVEADRKLLKEKLAEL